MNGAGTMTTKERHRRARAYARACKRRQDYGARVGWTPQDPGNLGILLALAGHESHAWARLPECAQATALPPGVQP